MKIKTTLLTVIVSVNSLCLSGQEKFDNSVCWEIRKTRFSSPSYILGSIHTMDTTQINFQTKKFCQLIDQCGNICLEVITKTDSTVSKEMVKSIVLPNFEKNITNSLDKDYYDRLMQMVDSSKNVLKRCKPIIGYIRPTVLGFFIIMEKQLTRSALFKNSNFKPDQFFEEYSRGKNYEINQLETMQQQLDWIYAPKISFEESLKTLKIAIDDFSKPDTIDMFLNYRNQNLALLKPEVYNDSIMVLRNKGMANGIDSLISKKPSFIIIGAAHLPYQNGVLNLLANKGYFIKPYKVDFRKQ